MRRFGKGAISSGFLRQASKLVSLVFLSTCMLLAQKRISVSTVSHGYPQPKSASVRSLDDSECPNQGGLLDSISVPVGQPLTLEVYINQPSNVDETFDLTVSNPAIASAGDTTQAFLGSVTVPAGQVYSQPFTVLGNSVGETILLIGSESGDYLPSETPLTAWDINPTADPSMKFLDANPSGAVTCRDPGTPNISQNPLVLATCGTPVNGVATDGVSQLLMRLQAGLPGTACFTITSSGSNQGTILTAVTSTQEFALSDYAFSLYQAPDSSLSTTSSSTSTAVLHTKTNSLSDSSDSSSATVQVQFAYTPSFGNGNTTNIVEEFTTIPPPLLLIHGLWSSRSVWPDIWNRQPFYEYLTEKADYSATNSASFGDSIPTIQTSVAQLLSDFHAEKFAGTTVDVIAHSMGGNLARLYAQSSNYKRPDNFNKGDIHRLVTLDTPHEGASLANLLIELYKLHSNVSPLVNAIADSTGHNVTQGAICDLAENSPALKQVGLTTIPSKVVTGTGGTIYYYKSNLEKALQATTYFGFGSTPVYDKTIVDDFRFTQSNDQVVPLTSQQASTQVEQFNFNDYVHSGKSGIVTGSDVATQAFAFLEGDQSSPSYLPAVISTGLGTPITVQGQGDLPDEKAYAAECLGLNPPLKQPSSAAPQGQAIFRFAAATTTEGDSRVQIVSPRSNLQASPGETVTVTLTVADTIIPKYVAVEIGGGVGTVEASGSSNNTYQISFVVPIPYVGMPPVALVPDVLDASNNFIQGSPVNINVRPPGSLTALSLSQNHFFFLSPTEQDHIDVQGSFAGDQTAILTPSSTGTTYLSNNIDVLAVSSEGIVQAKNFGTAVVTVENSGLKTFATYTIENPSAPLHPQDFTNGVNFENSGFRLDRNTGFFVQTVQISNTSPTPLLGPLYFTVQNLPSGVRLMNAGTTQTIQPTGIPYLAMPLPDRLTLQPGASVIFNLQFLNPGRMRISYTPKVYRTLATP